MLKLCTMISVIFSIRRVFIWPFLVVSSPFALWMDRLCCSGSRGGSGRRLSGSCNFFSGCSGRCCCCDFFSGSSGSGCRRGGRRYFFSCSGRCGSGGCSGVGIGAMKLSYR